MTQPFKLIPDEARVATVEHGFSLRLDAFSIESRHSEATFRFERAEVYGVIVSFTIGKGRGSSHITATYATSGEAIAAATKALMEGDAAWEALEAAQDRLKAAEGFLAEVVAPAPT